MNDNKYEIYKSTMHKMMHIGRLHRTIFERNISKMGIHHSQHHLLMYIAKEGEVISQKHIAEKFGITPAAIARTLKELESEGFIERSSIENDSRCNKVVITQKGKDIVKKTRMLFNEVDESMFVDFSSEDINRLNELLDNMQARLLEKNEENCCCVRKTDEKQ